MVLLLMECARENASRDQRKELVPAPACAVKIAIVFLPSPPKGRQERGPRGIIQAEVHGKPGALPCRSRGEPSVQPRNAMAAKYVPCHAKQRWRRQPHHGSGNTCGLHPGLDMIRRAHTNDTAGGHNPQNGIPHHTSHRALREESYKGKNKDISLVPKDISLGLRDLSQKLSQSQLIWRL